MDQETLDELILLKAQVRRNWQVVRDEKMKEADRKAAAENIVDLQEKIQKIDKTFKPVDLSDGDYAKFLTDRPAPKLYKVLTDAQVAEIQERARMLFETKLVIEKLANIEFKDYANGPSVGQALQLILDSTGTRKH